MKILSRLKYFLILGIGALIALLMLLAGEAHTWLGFNDDQSNVVFAEGLNLCNGKMMGTANFNDPNGGIANFDSHPVVTEDDEGDPAPVLADLSIIGLAPGYAPADPVDAACIDFLDGVDKDEVPVFMNDFLDEQYPDEPALAIEYLVKGYVWNDNLGFVSLYCEGGANQGKACGDFDYGVGLTNEIDGLRKLVGYAWNQTVGYISFARKNSPIVPAIPDEMDLVRFAPPINVSVGLNNYQVFTTGTFSLNGKKYVEVLVDNGVDAGSSPVEDGTVKEINGLSVRPIGISLFPVQGATIQAFEGSQGYEYEVYVDEFNKIRGYAYSAAQMYLNFFGVNVTLPQEIEPCLEGDPECEVECECGVCSDPDSGEANICVEPDPETLGSIYNVNVNGGARVADGVDGYQLHLVFRDDLNYPVDFATLNGELEFVWIDTVKQNQLDGSSVGSFLNTVEEPWSGSGGIVKKPVVVDDENFDEFFQEYTNELGLKELGHYVLKTPIRSFAPTSNENVSYTVGSPVAQQHKNEHFIYDVSTVNEDAIEENKLILKSIKLTKEDGEVVNKFPNGYPNGVNFRFKPAIEIDTLYSGNMQDDISAFREIPVGFVATAKVVSESEAFSYLPVVGTLIKLVLDYEDASNAESFDFNFIDENGESLDTSVQEYGSIEELPKDLFAVASIPDVEDGEVPFLDSIVKGPSLYSEISYVVEGTGKTIKYYNNKLPRENSSVANPAVVVHGNVYAPKAFSPIAAQQVQETGHLSIDVVRNTVNENIKKYFLNDAEEVKEGGECVVSRLTNSDDSVFKGEVEWCSYENYYKVDGENILYFKNADVNFSLESSQGLSYLSGDWLVVVEDGNVFIDKNIYSGASPLHSLAIVVLKTHESSCKENNVYIDANVQNVQANIASDCSVFSYDSTMEGMIGEDGLPDWGDSGTMIEHLDKQLLIEGSVASRNTIGGADLDKYSEDNVSAAKEYLLLGTGGVLELPVSAKDRLLAQTYDLNYLRLFRLELEFDDDGLPVDQKCGKGLTNEDLIAIAAWKLIPPWFNPVPPVVGVDGKSCDGIDLEKFDGGAGESLVGDLVAGGESPFGLEVGDFTEPVYIFYKAPKSFVFKKAETISK